MGYTRISINTGRAIRHAALRFGGWYLGLSLLASFAAVLLHLTAYFSESESVRQELPVVYAGAVWLSSRSMPWFVVILLVASFPLASFSSRWMYQILVSNPEDSPTVQDQGEQRPQQQEMKGAVRVLLEVTAQGVSALLVLVLSAIVFFAVLENPFYELTLPFLTSALAFLAVGALFQEEVRIIRGERLAPVWWVRFKAWRITRNDPDRFLWAGVWYPFYAGSTSLAIIGAPRTGKTVNIRLFLQSTAPRVFRRKDYRMLILDVKGEALPILAGMGIDTSVEAGKVRTLHPEDRRAWVWDMAADIRDNAAIRELALILVPPPKKEDPVWANSSRGIVVGILKAWTLQGKAWTLRDLLAAMRSVDRMRAVLRSDPETLDIIDRVISEAKEAQRTTQSVVLSLYSYVADYEDIATAWHNILHPKGAPPRDPAEGKHPRLLSLTDWLGINGDTQGYIITLGTGKRDSPVDLLARMVIARIGQLVRDRQDDNVRRRTWIVLDELRMAGKLDVETLLAIGGGRGIGCVIGFQDKSGLDEEYETDIANEVLGLCQNKAFTALSTDPTAEWAERELGGHEVQRSQGREKRALVMKEELMSTRHFPKPTPDGRVGITLVAKPAFLPPYKAYLRPRWYRWRLKPLKADVPGIDRPPTQVVRFPDWTAEEERYFTETISPRLVDLGGREPRDSRGQLHLVKDDHREELPHEPPPSRWAPPQRTPPSPTPSAPLRASSARVDELRRREAEMKRAREERERNERARGQDRAR